ncbi:nuclear transport factor 2 family protein [Flavobacterium sp. ov086]|jgi:ketosteroid isomerase-like protein|uniref:YybH family protein n=1 Tax=Flavobacterium sp. ov086 TaxID=1761785 RepID=UPI000B66D935|nr:nuclear transport factor 2 family protein [Flavobacterium sp. ov086]SNR76560.1 hypothetical protein SAMN04487979_12033 [Flavobacterium sp. ov086]
MNYQKEKEAVSAVLGDFAQALNTGQSIAIPEFFAQDGVFIPEGMKTILGRDQLGKTDKGYLRRSDFKISYTLKDITIDGQYAFVEALATTTEKRVSDLKLEKKTSTDFFVLKFTEEHWKIYRYVFNNVRYA